MPIFFCVFLLFPRSRGHLCNPNAKLLGVWPPTDTTTPRGLSNSAMSMTFSWLNLWPWSIAVSWFPFFWWDRWYVITQLAVYTTYIPLIVLATWFWDILANFTYKNMMGYLGKFHLQKHDEDVFLNCLVFQFGATPMEKKSCTSSKQARYPSHRVSSGFLFPSPSGLTGFSPWHWYHWLRGGVPISPKAFLLTNIGPARFQNPGMTFHEIRIGL